MFDPSRTASSGSFAVDITIWVLKEYAAGPRQFRQKRACRTHPQKDPLRPLTQEERKLLVRVSRSTLNPLRMSPGQSTAGRSRGEIVTRGRLKPPGVVRRMPSPGWCGTSAERGSPRSSRAMVAAQLPSTPPKSASASSKRYAGDPIVKRREPQPGRFLRYRELCVGLLMGCPR